MSLEGVDVGGADAESGATKQVIDFRVELSHGGTQSEIVRTSFVKVVA